MSVSAPHKFSFHDFEPEIGNFYDDVVAGLSLPRKQIPPKYFYDDTGSRLFDAICETEEYYPTRTEMAIMEANLAEICECLGHDCVLIEPGSGSSQKVRMLLDRLEPHIYMPLDISLDYLKGVAHQLADEYPHIHVAAACVDYTSPFALPHIPQDKRKVAFFPGSSIGNFEPKEAVNFLNNLRNVVGDNGGLLIGVDLKKDNSILDAAYNDDQGITAQFNLNLLQRMQAELGAKLDSTLFAHRAFYNPAGGRVEMHLQSRQAQVIQIDQHRFHLAAGEMIHTENSYKYSIAEFQSVAQRAGFVSRKVWTDRNQLFSLHYFEPDKSITLKKQPI